MGAAPDFVGYENLISFIRERGIHRLEGDLVEIGAFMGGGTAKLAAFAREVGKRVFVVDVFEPSLDRTMSPRGVAAREVYEAFLEGRDMFAVYSESVRPFDNVVTIRQDSRTVRFPPEQRFVFAFIDGCHQEEYVLSDFALLWPRVVSGGCLGFHDYEYADWPEVTIAVRRILAQHREEIAETCEVTGVYDIRSLLLIKR